MVFPVETEEREKWRALSVCQDHLRKVLDIVRKVTQMVDIFTKNDVESAQQTFNEIRKMEDEVNSVRRRVVRELAEIGGILTSREDYLRFVNQTGEIADLCEGIAFRLLEILERGWKGFLEVKTGVLKLSEAMFETVMKLRETTLTLNYSATKTIEKAREVEVAERLVDDIYRELEIQILNSNIELPVLLLLRDITQLLEDVSDKAEDASDAVRILAFAM